ncbi:MAG: hypothetical protein F9K13_02640 [Candidatus Methylomirabilis oxygeniifera]|uniref:Uncharacterized protein n=1 Tax=Methylomirabilis oxygeniifera TaxID=671143 RepID=D5MF56_METO1|nr:MAG: hypothetical protein F9K13_02640 [Candidatus Methylomirabilis oxyfera]CBE68385.1 protein of unknown function [Candidatus Methylomirabilis oxyfera]
MKIRQLEFKPFAAKKPLLITSEGRFLTVQQVAETPSLGMGSLFTLSEELQAKLAIERYSLEPDFKLGIIQLGVYSKDDIIDHIKKGTEFGKLATRTEMGYCSELATSLMDGKKPSWPQAPSKPTKIPPPWKPVKHCIWLRVSNRALFCENTTDGVTTPIANWRIANVHSQFQTRGFTVVALTGTNDVRANFVPVAKNVLTTYIGGVGHGNYDVYTGHSGDPILRVSHYDPTEVKDKTLHFLSCRTARDLGPNTVTNGAKAYCGYDENFTFVWDNSSTPVNEFLLFLQSDATFDLQMAAGATAGQAFNAAQQAFNAAIAQVPNTAAAAWLTFDRDHMRLHGSTTATITPYRWVKICFPIRPLEMETALLGAGVLED